MIYYYYQWFLCYRGFILSSHIHFSVLCTVPAWVGEIMDLAVLLLDWLSPYQMGPEYPIYLTKLHSQWFLHFVGAQLPKTTHWFMDLRICLVRKCHSKPHFPRAGLGSDGLACPVHPRKQLLHAGLGARAVGKESSRPWERMWFQLQGGVFQSSTLPFPNAMNKI